MCARAGARTATAEAGGRAPWPTIGDQREEVAPPRWGGSARPGHEPGPRRRARGTACSSTCKFMSARLITAILKLRLKATLDFGTFEPPPSSCSSRQNTRRARTHTTHVSAMLHEARHTVGTACRAARRVASGGGGADSAHLHDGDDQGEEEEAPEGEPARPGLEPGSRCVNCQLSPRGESFEQLPVR